MSTDTGRERTDEGRQRGRTVDRLTPAAKPARNGELPVPSREPADQSEPRERNESSPAKEDTPERVQRLQGPSAPPAWLVRLRYYGLALLLVGVAALLRWVLWDVLNPTPFLIFYLAWVAAAAFGGLGPGLLATLASWLCIELLFDYGPSHIGFSDLMSLIRLLIFLAGGLVVSIVGEKMRRSRMREHRQMQVLAAANTTLQASEASLTKAQAIARLGNWEVDTRTRKVRGSQELHRLFNLGPEATLDAYIEKFHPEDRQRLIVSITAAARDKKPYSVDYRVVPSAGVVRYVHSEGEAIYDEKGLPITYFGTLQDITERKQAEEALRASEEKYRFLVENSKDVTWTLDLQGNWTFISSNVEKVTGYQADELRRIPLRDFLAPECRHLIEEKLRRRARGEDSPPYEVVVLAKDRRRIPVEVVTASILDESGNIVGVQGVSRDITERKRAEAALRESEQRYRGIVEDQTELICLFQGDMTIAFVNDAYCRYFGKRQEELVGRQFLPLIAEEDRNSVQARIVALSPENPVVTIEERVRRPDGSIAWQEWKNRAVFDGQGRLTGYQAVGRDITERKRAERDLKESHDRYQALTETTADFIWEMDAQGKYTYCSPQMRDLWGYEPQDMIGKTPFELMPPEDREQALRAFMSLAQSPQSFAGLEASSYDSRGRLITVEVSGVPFFDADGRLLGYRGISRDVTERKHAQEALAESRKKYRGLVEKVNDWVWEIDAEGVYTYASPRALELLGYAPEEIVGKTPFDFMPPAEAQRVWDAFQPTWLARKPLEQFENTLVRKDGRLVTVETSGMPVFADDGTFLGYTGIDRDVTARKQAEEALRASQSMLQSVMKNVPQGIFWKDRQSTYLGCNDVFVQAVGLESAADIVGKTDYDLPWSPEQTASFREYDRRIMENDAPEYHIVEQMQDAHGKLAWVETNKVPLHDAQGHVMGILGTYEDITERKRAEEALRESEEKFRVLAETSPAAILIYQDGKYVYANPAAESLTGYSRDELIEQALGDLVHPDYRQQVRELAARRARGERVSVRYEAKIVTKDGRERWMDNSSVLIMYRNQPGGLLIAFDITERKKAEEALRELNATLENKVARRTRELEYRAQQLQKLTLELTEAEERERKRLAGILHDDLQQVLAAAKFQVGLLSSRVKNDAESHDIAEQTKDLLGDAIAKSRNLSHELSAPGLSRSDLIEAFEWLAEQMQTKHGFTVHLDLDERIEVASEPLRVLLYKAAQELLFNAIKHAGVHEAKLRLRHRRGRLRLLVSDTGRGFEPAEPGCTLGFGLLSIRERVEYLGGRMKIRSAPGKGSLFVITLPDSDAREHASARIMTLPADR